jgi:hypothetical protein
MLGLFLIYFIGKRFYELAGKFDKNQWGFAIAGIAFYYAGTFIVGVVVSIYFEFNAVAPPDEIDDLTLNLIAIPFGLLACFGLYKILEKSWKRKVVRFNSEILDQEISEL